MRLKSLLYRLNRKDQPFFVINKKIFTYALVIVSTITILSFVTIALAQEAPAATANPLLDYQEATSPDAPANRTLFNKGSLIEDFPPAGVDAIFDIQSMPKEILQGQRFDKNGNPIVWIPGGAIGSVNTLTAALYKQPISGVEYIASTWSNFLGKPAYAQGVGFQGLQPILPIWKGFRNVVYILSSIIFIIMALMIVLRIKISPQAVISIQSAIPQLITTLLLVTFSYAIAGLLIDGMYLFQSIGISTLFTAMGKGLGENLLREENPWQMVAFWSNSYNFSNLAHGGINDYGSLFAMALPTNVILIFSLLIGAIIAGVLSISSFGIGTPVALAVGGGISVIILLIISIAILVAMLNFFFGCLKAYVTVIFKIVLAPLEIGMGAFPGSKMGFSTWIWDIIANLAIFPVSLLFLILANMIIQASAWGPGVPHLWAPALIDDSAPGVLARFFTAASGGIVPVAIGFATVMLLSKLPEMIPQFIFMIKPSAWSSAIGQTMGGFSKLTAPLGPMATSIGLTTGLNTADSLAKRNTKNAQDRYNRTHDDADKDAWQRAQQVQSGVNKFTGIIEEGAVHGKLMGSRGINPGGGRK